MLKIINHLNIEILNIFTFHHKYYLLYLYVVVAQITVLEMDQDIKILYS